MSGNCFPKSSSAWSLCSSVEKASVPNTDDRHVGALCGYTVVGVQGVEERAQDATLGRSSVEGQRCWSPFSPPDFGPTGNPGSSHTDWGWVSGLPKEEDCPFAADLQLCLWPLFTSIRQLKVWLFCGGASQPHDPLLGAAGQAQRREALVLEWNIVWFPPWTLLIQNRPCFTHFNIVCVCAIMSACLCLSVRLCSCVCLPPCLTITQDHRRRSGPLAGRCRSLTPVIDGVSDIVQQGETGGCLKTYTIQRGRS